MKRTKEAVEQTIRQLTDRYNIVLSQMETDLSYRLQAVMLDVKMNNDKYFTLFREQASLKGQIEEWQEVLKELNEQN